MEKLFESLKDWKTILIIVALLLLIIAVAFGAYYLLFGGIAAIPKTVDMVKPFLKYREEVDNIAKDEKAKLKKEKRRLRRVLKKVEEDAQTKSPEVLRKELLDGIDDI